MLLYEIYALCEPDTGEVRYIGKAKDAAKRLNRHLKEHRRDYPVYRWIKKLAQSGLSPKLVILERTDNWQEAEIRLISFYKNNGLLNVALGGDEPFCSKETRAKNGNKISRLIHDDPERKRIWRLKKDVGEAIKDGYLTDYYREKLKKAASLAPHLFGEYAAL